MANPWLTKYNKLSYKHEQTNIFWTHDKIAGDIYEEHFSKFLKANSCTHIKLSPLLATQYVTEVMHLALFSVLSLLRRFSQNHNKSSIIISNLKLFMLKLIDRLSSLCLVNTFPAPHNRSEIFMGSW